MTRSIPVLTLLCCSTVAYAQNQAFYKCRLDLTRITNDVLPVEIELEQLPADTVVYNLPAVVPGTYSISDFGGFARDFQASQGNEKLTVKQLNTNQVQIIGTQGRPMRLAYGMHDTFDGKEGRQIFKPGGTNWEDNTNYLLNFFGIIGYLEGYTDSSYHVTVRKPEGFYGASSLSRAKTTDTSDTFMAERYFTLHDCPAMYSIPDTASTRISNTEVFVSVYSDTQKNIAPAVLDSLVPLFRATAAHFGEPLPSDKYTILVYLSNDPTFYNHYGALEHHTSTVVVMPDMPLAYISGSLRDVTAHEFLHIYTPLNVHSEEIHNFDFINPKMSEHLWLYEGTTEYHAFLVQVRDGIISGNEFLETVRQKLADARSYKNKVAFTEMSRNVLTKYEDEYGNVYAQGFLIGLCMDLILLRDSEGEYGLRELLLSLSDQYGSTKPFKDSELFDKLVQLSGNENLGRFMRQHVAGTEPLPVEELFGELGIDYKRNGEINTLSGGNVALELDEVSGRIEVASTAEMNRFGQKLGFKEGDEILFWNGRSAAAGNFSQALEDFQTTVKPGEKVVVEVLRTTPKGKQQRKKLKARAMGTSMTVADLFATDEAPSQTELNLRRAWIGPGANSL